MCECVCVSLGVCVPLSVWVCLCLSLSQLVFLLGGCVYNGISSRTTQHNKNKTKKHKSVDEKLEGSHDVENERRVETKCQPLLSPSPAPTTSSAVLLFKYSHKHKGTGGLHEWRFLIG